MCPEQLSGLPTPEPRAEVTTPKDWLASKIVLDQFGNDVTSNYEKEPKRVLKKDCKTLRFKYCSSEIEKSFLWL